jgi:hypothetical protein
VYFLPCKKKKKKKKKKFFFFFVVTEKIFYRKHKSFLFCVFVLYHLPNKGTSIHKVIRVGVVTNPISHQPCVCHFMFFIVYIVVQHSLQYRSFPKSREKCQANYAYQCQKSNPKQPSCFVSYETFFLFVCLLCSFYPVL